MVCNDPHGNIRLFAFPVPVSRQFSDFVYHAGEYVCVVIARLALKDHTEPFEAHSGIHIPVGKRLQFSVGLPVELHEDQIPYFDHQRIALVYEFPARNGCPFLVATQVHVYFAARTARAGITHFPEIVMFVPEEYPVFRNMQFPPLPRFRVHFGPVLAVAPEYRDVQSVLVDAVDSGQQFPCPVYRLGLEIIAETPVPEHLEHCMVVGVMSHFFEVVVLSADSQTFLTVGHSPVFRSAVPEEPVLELVHPGIGEHECRVVLHHHRGRRNYSMSFGREKVQERLSDFFRCHN